MLRYAGDNRGQFPRTRWDPDSSKVNAFTNPSAPDPFAPDGPLPNDVTASLYLLAREEGVEPGTFLCPLTDLFTEEKAAPGWEKKSNFPGPTALTYSMTNPFPTRAVADAGFRWDTSRGADFPLLADMNPGTGALGVNSNTASPGFQNANTLNHFGRRGQNVLFADGHVDQVDSPLEGVHGDNIYTRGPVSGTSGGSGVTGPPTSPDDAIMLPAASIDPMATIDPWTRDRRLDRLWDYKRYTLLAVMWTFLFFKFRVLQNAQLAIRYVYNTPARDDAQNVAMIFVRHHLVAPSAALK
jgi:prepilin-type processing-associated H-X9-DG protein